MAGEPRRRATKAELRDILLNKLNSWVEQGDTPEQAIERLTLRQYDFLIEQGVDLDNFILTAKSRRGHSQDPSRAQAWGIQQKVSPSQAGLV